MIARRSSWLLRGSLLLPISFAIGFSNFHIALFRPETPEESIRDIVRAAFAIMGLLCVWFVPFSLIRDHSRLRKSH
jgi:Na+-transporting NADH:ubiquinone oxidoreductase subunit NqrD